MPRTEAEQNKVNLRGAALTGANLRGANLSGVNLYVVDLRGATLCDANLRGANLCGATLSGANLRGADLIGADLSDAILRGANLSDAILRGAFLRGANLSGANLSGADLSGANLSGANLSGADLSDAILVRLGLGEYTVLPTGETWKVYREQVVPELLRAGGHSVSADAWKCHVWTNCPMSEAFAVNSLEKIPWLYRPRVEQFITFFDYDLLQDCVPEPEAQEHKSTE